MAVQGVLVRTDRLKLPRADRLSPVPPSEPRSLTAVGHLANQIGPQMTLRDVRPCCRMSIHAKVLPLANRKFVLT